MQPITMIISLILCIFIVDVGSISSTYGEMLIIEGDGISISLDGKQNTITLDTIDDPIFDSKIKMYHTGAFTLKNSENGVHVWVHPFSDTQYRIVVLTYTGEIRVIQKIIGTIILSEEPNRIITGQRDLGAVIVNLQKTPDDMTPKERMLYEKQQNVKQVEDIYQKKLESIRDGKSSKEILKNYEDSQVQTGMKLVKPDGVVIVKNPTINSSDAFTIQAFTDITPRIKQQQNLKISVLVTDDTRSNINGVFGWVGLGINDAKITGYITDPQGKVINTFNGKSTGKGVFETEYLVPTNALTRGEYSISITVTKDTAQSVILTDTFFVMEIDSGNSFDDPPVSNAGEDQLVNEHENKYYTHATGTEQLLYTKITLDGTNSTDVDSSITSYFWKQINGTIIPLSDYTSPTPWFNSTNVTSIAIVDENNMVIELINSTTIQFDLTVTSKFRSSIDSVFVTIEYVRELLCEPIVKQVGESLGTIEYVRDVLCEPIVKQVDELLENDIIE